MRCNISVYSKRIDKYVVYKGWGVVNSPTGIEYYITKDNPMSKLISKQVLIGSSISNYNREYNTIYSIEIVDKNAIIKLFVFCISLGSKELKTIQVTPSDKQAISILHKPTNIEIFKGNGFVDINDDDFFVKIIEQKGGYNGKLIRQIGNDWC